MSFGSLKPGMKLLKLELDENGARNIVRNIDKKQMLDYGQRLAKQLDQVEPVKDGWRTKLYMRPKRLTVVIYTMEPSVRFREAVKGTIKRWVRAKTKKGNIKLKKTKKGFEPYSETIED